MVSALLLSLYIRPTGLALPASTRVVSGDERYALIVGKDSKITDEEAQMILRSQAAPDSKQFAVLKYKQFSFLVEPSLVSFADERRQLESAIYLIKNATKELVEFGRLPLEVQGSLAIIGGQIARKLDLKRTQVFLGCGVSLHLKRGKPGDALIFMDAAKKPNWPKWRAPASTGAEELKFISMSDQRPPNYWPSQGPLTIHTLDGITPDYRNTVIKEALDAITESRKRVCLEIRTEMERLGRELAATLPDRTEWSKQESKLFGQLPESLQREFFRTSGHLPGYGPGTDLTNEWIEIQVYPEVLFDDGMTRFTAGFTGFLK
ncbi:MAG: hypothetical protein JST35_10735 [Armatimonadetes bacterium]|nr:hypothetical protein [Armatimonadota bacterium]